MTQQNAQSTSEQAISENDLIAQRHAKLKQIEDQAKQTGTSPWPNTFKREHYAQDLQDQFADKSKEEIEAALQYAVDSERFICHRITNLLLSKKVMAEKQDSILTSTEQEILKLIALGRTTKEIASERFSSTHTIITHRKNIFRKLAVNNVHEATKYALRAGIVDSAEYYI